MNGNAYVMFLPLSGRKWINANGRMFWAEKSRRTREWRTFAAVMARAAHWPHLTRGRVVCELSFGDSRRRDPANWAPTAKAVIDGLVDAGVFPDDNYLHVTGPDMRIAGDASAGSVGMWVHIFADENLEVR